LGCGLLFLGLQIIYYGAILSLDSLGFESYQNQLAIVVNEGISNIVAEFFIAYLPRRLFSIIGICIGFNVFRDSHIDYSYGYSKYT
jgi:hypothetical protein